MTLKNRISVEQRIRSLKELISTNKFVRTIEVHNGISALVANNTSIKLSDNDVKEFDALWISSLTETASRGHPDAEILGFTSRLNTIHEVAEVTHKPIIVDGDTGGDINHFQYMVKKLERAGVSAVIIEDKVFPKRNSLDPNAKQPLENPKIFGNKIKLGKSVVVNDSFLIIARIESLIAGKGLNDALDRAKEYLLAGVDGIMIHSKESSGKDITDFAKKYKELCQELNIEVKPLVCVPTTYNHLFEEELKNAGFNIVIHANHLLRSAHKAMENTCRTILVNERSLETDPVCTPVKKIFELVGFDEIKKRDKEEELLLSDKMHVIIPASGAHPELQEVLGKNNSPCLLKIGEKTLLETQLSSLKKAKLNNFVIIQDEAKEYPELHGLKVKKENIKKNMENSILDSIFKAKEEMKYGFLLIFSDLVFDTELIKRVKNTKEDIVLVVDDSYKHHQHDVHKKLDLVTIKEEKKGKRQLSMYGLKEILRIGKELKKELTNSEFIGIAKFSPEGSKNFIKVYEDCKKNWTGRFHEAESFEKASFTDFIQELIDRGFSAKALQVQEGWMEIHNEKDYEAVKKEFDNNL